MIRKQLGYTAKHPFYGKIANIEPLFKEAWESFHFSPHADMSQIETHQDIVVRGARMDLNRKCYHIDIDLAKSGLKYTTGDHLGTWPENDPFEVQSLIKVLKLTPNMLDRPIKLIPNPGNALSANAKMPFPMPCSIRTALTYYVDLRATIKQYQLEVTSHELSFRFWPSTQKTLQKEIDYLN
jgi:NADPH-ferrihemoprotein reductase